MEEHVTMVKEPGSRFIGYVTPANSTAAAIATALTNYLVTEDYSLRHLVAISCDGTPTNTGNVGGVICLLEKQLQRPLQWLVCLFNFNELPFNALFKGIVGPATGPRTYSGPIGKGIHTCENIAVNIDALHTLISLSLLHIVT